jgi:hypothetical protein
MRSPVLLRRARPAMRELGRRERPSDRAGRGAGHDAKESPVIGDVALTLRLGPFIERLEQEVEDSRRVRPAGGGAREHEA